MGAQSQALSGARQHRRARFWDRIAQRYSRQPIKDMAAYERKLDHVLQRLKRKDSVLEIGCGTGSTALIVARGVGRITATDYSGAMIDIANGKLDADDPGNLRFLQADADEVHGRNQFDAVMVFNLLHLIEEPASVLASVHAQLKPGGLMLTKTPCLGELGLPIRLIVRIMNLLGLAPDVTYFSIHEHMEAIESAGFEIETQVCFDAAQRSPFVVARKPAD